MRGGWHACRSVGPGLEAGKRRSRAQRWCSGLRSLLRWMATVNPPKNHFPKDLLSPWAKVPESHKQYCLSRGFHFVRFFQSFFDFSRATFTRPPSVQRQGDGHGAASSGCVIARYGARARARVAVLDRTLWRGQARTGLRETALFRCEGKLRARGWGGQNVRLMPEKCGAGLIVSIVQCIIFMILGFANLFFGTATEKLTTVVSRAPAACMRAQRAVSAWAALPVVVLRAGRAFLRMRVCIPTSMRAVRSRVSRFVARAHAAAHGHMHEHHAGASWAGLRIH